MHSSPCQWFILFDFNKYITNNIWSFHEWICVNVFVVWSTTFLEGGDFFLWLLHLIMFWYSSRNMTVSRICKQFQVLVSGFFYIILINILPTVFRVSMDGYVYMCLLFVPHFPNTNVSWYWGWDKKLPCILMDTVILEGISCGTSKFV